MTVKEQDEKECLREEVEIVEGEIIHADFQRQLRQRILGGREQRTADAGDSGPQRQITSRLRRPVYVSGLPTEANERRELLERIHQERKARAARARAWASR